MLLNASLLVLVLAMILSNFYLYLIDAELVLLIYYFIK